MSDLPDPASASSAAAAKNPAFADALQRAKQVSTDITDSLSVHSGELLILLIVAPRLPARSDPAIPPPPWAALPSAA